MNNKKFCCGCLCLLLAAPLAQAQNDLLRGIVEDVGRAILEDQQTSREEAERRRRENEQQVQQRRAEQSASSPSSGHSNTAHTASPSRAGAAPEAAQGPASTTTALPSRQTVSRLQEMLNQLGYNAGPVDGLMGRKTATAIRAFQADQGVRRTGQPSASLALALQDALQNRPERAQSAPASAQSPSFDCRQARAAAEHAICGSGELARLDIAVHEAYQARLSGSSDRSSLRQRQRDWIQERNRCGDDSGCLATAMRAREAELRTTPAAPLESLDTRTVTDAVSPEAGQSREVSASAAPRAGGRVILTYPFDDTPHSEEERREIEKLERLQSRMYHAYLAHAEGADSQQENLLYIAWQHLDRQDTRDYLCSTQEMQSGQPGCMSYADAEWKALMLFDPNPGVVFESKGDGRFSWWRGANEFERKRRIQQLRDSPAVQAFLAEAPRPRVQYEYVLVGGVGEYDFDQKSFELWVRGLNKEKRVLLVSGVSRLLSGARRLEVAEYEHRFAVPPTHAEAFREKVTQLSGGDEARFQLHIAIEESLDQASAGWQATVQEIEYVLGDEADGKTLESLRGDLVQSSEEAAQSLASVTPSAEADGSSASVLRDLDLTFNEAGRLDFSPDDHDAVAYLMAAGLQGLSSESMHRPLGYLLKDLVKEDLGEQYLGCYAARTEKDCDRFDDFMAESEFEARRLRGHVFDELVPAMVREAPPLPIAITEVLPATLGRYDFGAEAFALTYRRARFPGFGVLRAYRRSLPSVHEWLPERLAMPPDQAEALLDKLVDRSVELHLDYDIQTIDVQRNAEMSVEPLRMQIRTNDGDVLREQSL
ncbi:peptidoglycan-binding protein [Halomonas halmophila]|uniref:Peptidoglycan binding-like domain-containing protein n=1 Tax=Halomonas halmophila TaxID=252 RepID=A0A4Y4F6M5_9GAMM|nr:peptidoglycan-binding protein [Halomonas halmophila]GED23504.1 hypothetical protein HHA01_24810 [Halomonas halmophila]